MSRYIPAYGRLILWLIMAIALTASLSYAEGAEEAVARIQKAYEGIQDMKGSFVQKNDIRDLNKTDTYTGDFFIKRPLKMKWAYRGKAGQDLIINNDTVIIYKKGDSQAYRSRFSKETFGRSPVVLLTGMGTIKDEFAVTGTDKALLLKPRKPMAGVTSITLHLSDGDFPIRAFTIRNESSAIVEIELKDIRVNTGIRESLFDLSLPKEVNIFEQPSL